MSVTPLAMARKTPNFTKHTVSPEEKQQILARINELNSELMEALNAVDARLSQELEDEILSTTQRFQAVNQELTRLNSEIGNTNTNLTDVNNALTLAISNLDTKTSDNLAELRKDSEDADAAQQQSLSDAIADYNQKITQLNSNMTAYIAANDSRVEGIENELSAYKSSNDQALNAYKTANNNRVTTLENNFEAFKISITDDLNQVNTTLTAAIEAVESDLSDYVVANDSRSKDIEDDLSAYKQSNNSALNAYKTANDARSKAIEDDLAAFKIAIRQELTSATTTLQQNIDSINSALNAYIASNNAVVSAISTKLDDYIISNNQALSSYITTNDARVKAIEDDLAKHKTDSSSALSNATTQLQQDIDGVATDLSEYEASNDSRVEDIETELANYKSSNDQALTSYKTSNNTRVKNVEDDLAAYKLSNNNALNSSVNTLTQSINSVSSELTSYKTSNDNRVLSVEEDIAAHLAANNPHGITPNMIGALTQALADLRYARLSGFSMAGDISMGQNILRWTANTDGAEIRFDNTGDAEPESCLHLVVLDNGNEFFKWSTRASAGSGGTETEWMTLKGDGLRIGGKLVYHEGHKPTTVELGIRTNAENDQRFHAIDTLIPKATLADTVTINSSTSTSFFNMLWNSGKTIYNTDGVVVRPSDGYTRLKHGSLAGNLLNHTQAGELVVGSTDKRSAGLYGIYDSARTSQIWSMGAAYKIADNGADFGNLYGLAYKHTNNVEQGTMGVGHQMVWVINGVVQASIGENIWAKNDIYAKGNVKGFSDKRLKKNFNVIEGALEKVMSLTGYTYDRIDLEDERHAGLIAQEVQKVLPEVVSQYGEYLTLSYGNLVALLVNAIKELAEKQK